MIIRNSPGDLRTRSYSQPASVSSDWRLAFAADLQDPGDDGRCEYADDEHDRQCRPRKVRGLQLADEILRRLHRIAGLGEILAGLQRHAVEGRAVGAGERSGSAPAPWSPGFAWPTSVAMSRSGVSIGGLLSITTTLRSMPSSRASATTWRSAGTSWPRAHADPVVGDLGLHRVHVDVGRDVRREGTGSRCGSGHRRNRTRHGRRPRWQHAPGRGRRLKPARLCFTGQAYC